MFSQYYIPYIVIQAFSVSLYKFIYFLVAFPVAPGTPVAVEIRQSSVLLEWSYDGDNRQISHFQVEQRQFGSQDWTVFGTVGALATTQVNATGLYPFTVYQFRVLSVNNNDVSSHSEPSDLVVTREAAPTATPFNVIVVESNYTAIVVAWEVSIQLYLHLVCHCEFCYKCLCGCLSFFLASSIEVR